MHYLNSLFFVCIFLQFYCIFGDEEFKFIYKQFKNCRSLEKGRLYFEEMKNNAEYGWRKIEPKIELENCVLEFDIDKYLNEIEEKFMALHNNLNNKEHPMAKEDEFEKLEMLTADLEKLNLKKNLLEFLGKKIGGGMRMTNEGIFSDSENEGQTSNANRGPKNAWDNPHFMGLKMQVEEVAQKGGGADGAGSSRGPVWVAGGDGQVLPETNVGRLQILQSLYNLRKTLNTEIKLLNMMFWLKKPRKYMEEFGNRIKMENEQKIVQMMDNFFRRQFVAQIGMGESSGKFKFKLKKDEEPRNFQKDFGEVEKNWLTKKIVGLRSEFEKIKKKLTSTKTKLKLKLKIKSRKGEMSSSDSEGGGGSPKAKKGEWPKYEELVEKMNLLIYNGKMMDLDIGKEIQAKMSTDPEERKQVDRMENFVKNKWNVAVGNVRAEINGIVEKYSNLKEEYEKIFHWVGLQRITSMMFKLMMGIFEWDNAEWRLASIWHLANAFMEPYILAVDSQIIEALRRKFENRQIQNPMLLVGHPKLMDDGQEMKGEDIQMQVVIDALRMFTFYEEMNKLHNIEGTNAFLNTEDAEQREEFEKLKRDISQHVTVNLPQNELTNEYWKWYEENAKRLFKAISNENLSNFLY